MTDDDKELVFALRKCWQDDPELKQAANRIEALSAENERLREALALKDQYFKGIAKLATLGEQ